MVECTSINDDTALGRMRYQRLCDDSTEALLLEKRDDGGEGVLNCVTPFYGWPRNFKSCVTNCKKQFLDRKKHKFTKSCFWSAISLTVASLHPIVSVAM